jgi:hypothetical protein
MPHAKKVGWRPHEPVYSKVGNRAQALRWEWFHSDVGIAMWGSRGNGTNMREPERKKMKK